MVSSKRSGLEDILDHLILRLVVQEEAGLKNPPKVHSRESAGRARSLLRQAMDAWGHDRVVLRPWRLMLVYVRLVIGLRRLTGRLWEDPLAAWRVAHQRMRGHSARLREVASYATSSPKEDQSLRLSILLRVMGHRAASASTLARRVQCGLASPWCNHFLGLLLADMGYAKAAAGLAATELPGPAPASAYAPRRLRYGVVVMTMFDTDIFRASVQSLKDSDYSGAIVVVEDGVEPARACEDFCRALGVTYVKNPVWEGCAAALNLGIRHLPQDTDIVLSSHNDVLWPGEWFADLDRAWDRVWDSDKVSLLNLSYLQCSGWVDASLKALFVRGRHDDLVWVLRSMREIPHLMNRVQDVQSRPGESPFGLGRDPLIDSMTDLRQMTGRSSVAASFPLHVWREIGGFDPGLVYAFDLQLLHHNLTAHRWALFVGNAPLLHLKSSDTEAISSEKKAEVGTRFLTSTYEGFQRKFGWHIEHFLNIYFSESTIVHREAILRAVNRGRFDEVDFVFDDFRRRLGDRTLSNCELTWCRSRAQCPYAALPV